MANDPRDLDGSRLQRALHLLGRDPALRTELVRWLKTAEARLVYSGSVRDEVTGPIVDALHTDEDRYDKSLDDGTRFQFLYRTKIAREFLMADREHPSHVWEPQTTRLLRYLTQRSDGDVLIGGAYFGDHAVLLGCQLRDTGRWVHCFEPNADQAAMLGVNARLNGLVNMRIQQLGLWRTSSDRLRLDGFDSFANAVPAADGEEGFSTVSMDDYCETSACRLGVIMLDIEGAELAALEGARHVLERDRPSVVFEVHRDYVDWSQGLGNAPICRLLGDAGYHLFAVRDFNSHQEMGDRRVELVPVDTVYLEGPSHGFNMLAVPNRELLDVPLFRLVDHVSPKLLRHKAPHLHHPVDGLPA